MKKYVVSVPVVSYVYVKVNADSADEAVKNVFDGDYIYWEYYNENHLDILMDDYEEVACRDIDTYMGRCEVEEA